MNRTGWGWIITIVYFIVIFIIGTIAELSMPKNWSDWGDFLSGLCSPVAFIWLIIGYYQQQSELQQNTEALRLQAGELKNSVKVAEQQLDQAKKSFIATVKQSDENMQLNIRAMEAPYTPRIIISLISEEYSDASSTVIVKLVVNVLNADAYKAKFKCSFKLCETDEVYNELLAKGIHTVAVSEKIHLKNLVQKGMILTVNVEFESMTKRKYDDCFIFKLQKGSQGKFKQVDLQPSI
ncbi:hypothetical protein PCE38_002743 [Citrobacter freundii]|nr:hypothetical protein [Citrobacter freundii]